MELSIPRGTEFLLRELVQERTGMLYDNRKEALLLEKLSPLVIDRGFQSFLDYYYLLKYDSIAVDEWPKVFDAISVQETFFWREMDQVRALVDILVPEWEKRSAGSLRIWSAGCATGEEPLSIAMALTEAGWTKRVPIEIVATDASNAAIRKAKEGIFRERSFRNLPGNLRDKYFEKVDKGWKIDSGLHQLVTWDHANLINKQEISRFATAPFILCRNVFIYFSTDTVSKVVRNLAEFMPSPGYLFIGVSESLLRTTTDFELLDIGKAFVYKNSPASQSQFLQGLVSEMKGRR